MAEFCIIMTARGVQECGVMSFYKAKFALKKGKRFFLTPISIVKLQQTFNKKAYTKTLTLKNITFIIKTFESDKIKTKNNYNARFKSYKVLYIQY